MCETNTGLDGPSTGIFTEHSLDQTSISTFLTRCLTVAFINPGDDVGHHFVKQRALCPRSEGCNQRTS